MRSQSIGSCVLILLLAACSDTTSPAGPDTGPAADQCQTFIGSWQAPGSFMEYRLQITPSGSSYVIRLTGKGTSDVQVASCENGSLVTTSQMIGNATSTGPDSLVYFGSEYVREQAH